MVKRLRHRPFTAVTRVRFSLESPGKTLLVKVFFLRFSLPNLFAKAGKMIYNIGR